MKKIFLTLIILTIGFSTKIIADNSTEIKSIFDGGKNSKIKIIVYESLTCSHCADFHNKTYPLLKENFIDNGLATIEFRSFPLDLAALNASKIAHCRNDGKPDILHYLFKNQNKWTKGNTIEEINKNLKNVINNGNYNFNFEKCISDAKVEKYILEERINGHNKYKINATPTMIILEEKFEKPLTYKNLKKYLEKLI
tara:strand:- start:51 stop:641 length:591 start_codon:yes stop_codon:yes gene_type:complete